MSQALEHVKRLEWAGNSSDDVAITLHLPDDGVFFLVKHEGQWFLNNELMNFAKASRKWGLSVVMSTVDGTSRLPEIDDYLEQQFNNGIKAGLFNNEQPKNAMEIQ